MKSRSFLTTIFAMFGGSSLYTGVPDRKSVFVRAGSVVRHARHRGVLSVFGCKAKNTKCHNKQMRHIDQMYNNRLVIR